MGLVDAHEGSGFFTWMHTGHVRYGWRRAEVFVGLSTKAALANAKGIRGTHRLVESLLDKFHPLAFLQSDFWRFSVARVVPTVFPISVLVVPAFLIPALGLLHSARTQHADSALKKRS